MSRHGLLIDETRLFERLCETNWLRAAFKQVRKNKGSPGVDGITTPAFGSRMNKELSQLKVELERWTYKSSPDGLKNTQVRKGGHPLICRNGSSEPFGSQAATLV